MLFLSKQEKNRLNWTYDTWSPGLLAIYWRETLIKKKVFFFTENKFLVKISKNCLALPKAEKEKTQRSYCGSQVAILKTSVMLVSPLLLAVWWLVVGGFRRHVSNILAFKLSFDSMKPQIEPQNVYNLRSSTRIAQHY